MSRHHRPPEDTNGEESFVGRWSRRKGQAKSDRSPPAQGKVQSEAKDLDEKKPVKCDEDMPPVDSIDENSDVSDFFSQGVSEPLRKAALRKFFHSPAFNIVDGLDDYDDDFTTFKALGDIVTADMRHRMEVEKEREKEKAESELAHEGQEEPTDTVADDERDKADAADETGADRDVARSEVDGATDDNVEAERGEKQKT
ncbi:MAG: DUF3306 domain-containing protein [Arenicellales bacterium]|nr:DUF3306 domain-containing protein [Arenicellales bacterium]